MKTILFVLPDLFSKRNFLETPFYQKLALQKDFKPVFVFPQDNNHVKRGLIAFEEESYFGKNQRALWQVAKNMLARRAINFIYDTLTYRFNGFKNFQHQKIKEAIPKKYLISKKHDSFGFFVKYPFPKSKLLYDCYYKIYNSSLLVEERAKDLFKKYQPSLVVLASCQKPQVRSYAILAKKKNIPVISFINSWDHLTTDGPVLDNIDEYLVWNKKMEQELKKVHNNTKPVYNTGPLQMDYTFEPGFALSSPQLHEKLNLPHGQKIIVFGVYNLREGFHEPSIARFIVKNILEQTNAHLILRGHPKDNQFAKRYEEFLTSPRVTLCQLGRFFRNNWETTLDDQKLLASILQNSSLVICGGTTLSLDAIRFDKPVINPAFDGDLILPPEAGIKTRYGWDHYAALLKYNAIYLAESFEDLEAKIKKSLAEPDDLANARQLVRQDYLEPLDGQASSRLYDYLVKKLN